MTAFRRLCRLVAPPMAAVMFLASLPVAPARAAMVPTEQVIGGAEQATVTTAARDRARVIDFLAREDVRRQLRALGVDAGEAASRVDTLTDGEVRMLAGHIDELPAGQGFFTTLLVVALFLFVILLVTDILGYTDVFPFVKATAKR